MSKLIIFDCDGVLVDSEKLSIEVIVNLLKDKGVSAQAQDIEKYFKGAKLDSIFKKIEEKYSVKLPSIFGDKFRDLMNREFEVSLKPIDGIKEVLEQISCTVCVASSAPVDKIQNALNITGLHNFFGKNLFSSYTIDSWKPEPEIFLYAAREMDFSPANCIVIEDSPLGVLAASRAKMKVFGFCEASDRSELEKNGAIPFDKMDKLVELISYHL